VVGEVFDVDVTDALIRCLEDRPACVLISLPSAAKSPDVLAGSGPWFICSEGVKADLEGDSGCLH